MKNVNYFLIFVIFTSPMYASLSCEQLEKKSIPTKLILYRNIIEISAKHRASCCKRLVATSFLGCGIIHYDGVDLNKVSTFVLLGMLCLSAHSALSIALTYQDEKFFKEKHDLLEKSLNYINRAESFNSLIPSFIAEKEPSV